MSKNRANDPFDAHVLVADGATFRIDRDGDLEIIIPQGHYDEASYHVSKSEVRELRDWLNRVVK